MNDIVVGLTIGALCGSRSMTPPAIVTGAVVPRRAAIGLALLAAGELAADKHPQMPSRLEPLPFAGRVMTGALTAASVASPSRRLPMSIAGALGALGGTLLLYHLRRAATERGLSNVAAGLIEDGITLTAATALRRQLFPAL